jgi:hypothetical protein
MDMPEDPIDSVESRSCRGITHQARHKEEEGGKDGMKEGQIEGGKWEGIGRNEQGVDFYDVEQ